MSEHRQSPNGPPLGLPALGPWRADALCIEYPEVDFHPGRGESSAPAKAVCARCVVSEEFLSYALDVSVKFGVWGGLSERERRRLRAARKRPASTPAMPGHIARALVLDVLQTFPEGLTSDDLVVLTDLDKSTVMSALWRLMRRGRVISLDKRWIAPSW